MGKTLTADQASAMVNATRMFLSRLIFANLTPFPRYAIKIEESPEETEL